MYGYCNPAAVQDGVLVRDWAARMEAALKADSSRPQALLAIANPYGGARKAVKVWEGTAAPILERAGRLKSR